MKELEDYSWFPKSFRQEQSEFIGDLAVFTGIYNPFLKHLNEHPTKTNHMHDLCSGSGKPAYHIFKRSPQFNQLTCSDKFDVNKNIPIEAYRFVEADVLNYSYTKNETYTMLNAFHHFDNKEQLQIVNRIKDGKAEAFIIEILEPSLLTFIKILLAGTLGVAVLTPFISKMTWRKFLLTYIVPITILTVTIDGLISVLKSKSSHRYREQFKHLDNIVVKEFRSLSGKSILIHIQN